ncbi:MAG: SDR family NAD(P)-dependent oxidoreductase [Parahaliea sp.]
MTDRNETDVSVNRDGPEAPVVVVTGAGKGLGRAYAMWLAARGWRVVVNNRIHLENSNHSADRVVEDILCAGGEAIPHYGATEAANTGADLLQTALDRWGRLDAIIANAGVTEGRSFHKQKPEDFTRVLGGNRIARARYGVSDADTLGGGQDITSSDIASHWKQLANKPVDHRYASAVELFRAFIRNDR